MTDEDCTNGGLVNKLMQDVVDFAVGCDVPIDQPLECPEGARDAGRLLQYAAQAVREQATDLYLMAEAGDLRATTAALILEEASEVLDALALCNREQLADGLVDLNYVSTFCGVTFGFDLAPVWDTVQAANMAKLVDGKAVKNEAGKIQKPEGWTPPDIAAALVQGDFKRYLRGGV